MKIRKSKKVIGTTKFSPPVGYQIAPSAPAGGGTNVAAMRATFAFLPYNQDEVNKREYADKVKWRAENPTLPESDYPGMPDLYGRTNTPGSTIEARCFNTAGCIWNPDKGCITFKGTRCTPGIPPVY